MLRPALLRGVSASALTLVLVSPLALAQEQLPTIDVGAAQPVRVTGGQGQGIGPGLAGAGDGTGGTGPGGYGGAGAAQDPYNPTYVLENAGTGTKTDTPVMDTPLNVQSVSQQVLRDNQVTDLSKALQFVSGVTTANGATSNGNSYDSIVLRGFAANYIYRDGFRLDLGNGAGAGYEFGASKALQFGNVASVEVLKGPAAVLYGLSEPGGLVNIVTKQPLDQPYYAVNQQIGSLAQYRTSLDATGPLTPDKAWLYRINMSYENNGAPFGSFIDNTHAENIFLAPVLKWNIDNDNWVKLEAEYYRNNQAGVFPSDPQFNGSFITIPRNTNYSEYSPQSNNNIFAALTWSHNFDKDWSIKQLLAFNRYETDVTLRLGTGLDNFGFPYPALSGSPYTSPVFDRSLGSNAYGTQTLATEVNVTGHVDTWGAQHTLIFGGDFYSTLNWNKYYSSPLNSPESIFLAVHPGIPTLGPLAPVSEFTAPQDTAGLYVQDQVKLPYNFFFMAGARYQYFRQGGGLSGTPSFDLNLQGATSAPAHANSEQHATPRLGLLWRPFPWVSGFISYAEGFSTNTGIVYPNNPAPPTGARDAEAGFKFEFFEGKLRATVDYYNLTKTNVTESDLNPLHTCGGPPPSCSIVIGEERSKGPEVDVQGSPFPGLNLIVAYTNQSTAVTKTYLGDQSNQLGQPFQGIPRNVATFSSTYELQEGVLKGLKLGATYHYNGAQRINDGTGLNLGWLTPSLAGYGTVDLLADYPFDYDGWKLDAGLNVHNLLDRTYYTSAYLVSPLTGLGGAYGGRAYGDAFSVLGHISAHWPGSPSAPPKNPPPAMTWAHDWSGPYAGLQAGMGWGDNGGNFAYLTPDGFSGSPPFITNAYGVLAGAHVGYNRQFDHWVLGLEGSVDVTDLNKREQLGWANAAGGQYCPYYVGIFGVGCGGAIDAHISSDIQGSLRARAGYAWNRLFLYGTGGIALANFNLQSNLGGQDSFGNFYFAAANDRSTVRAGWTGGAGVEYAITNHWSTRAEWRYSDFGHIMETPTSFSTATGGLYYQGDRHVTQQQVQLGFSYKFGGDEPELVPVVPIIPVVKGPAVAANLPSLKGGATPPLPINWTGFYLGGQAGYAYGDNHGAYNFSTPSGVVGDGALTHDAQGVIFGGHVGYNYQFDNFVAGLEGSIDGSSLIERETVGASDANNDQAALTSMVQSDIQGAVRARAGYAFGRLLPFAAGGLAIGHFGTQSELAGANNTSGFYDGFATHGLQWTTGTGWTVGGGVEWAVNNNWSVRGEYRYSDFGAIADAPTVALPGTLYGGGRHLDQNQVQFGFSYKFGAPTPTEVIAKY
jgi:iron complex outermembrane receptor protein